ncbi:MAG: TauD/TfdA family dioxygenase [Ilumatobacteraceae bacterium]|nr:TauD/TfdA family dioxygenase [Ilumatobacteraceae bacterium]
MSDQSGPLEIESVNSRFGSRVTGIDLRDGVSDDTRDILRDLLWERGVLVFPGQVLTRDEQLDFTGIFAEPAPQPVRSFLGGNDCITVIDPQYVDGSAVDSSDHVAPVARFPEFEGWHSDSTFARDINAVATLRAEVTPPVGGDTCFASMAAAHDDLSPMLRDWLGSCEALHWYPPYFISAFKFHLYGADAEERFVERYQPWRHPVVVRHPETGRRSLFVNPVYTTEIVGLAQAESRELLTFLFRHATSSEYVYRHHWTPNDLVIWDELSMIHLAPQDFAPHQRRMVRATGGVIEPEAASGIVRSDQHSHLVRVPVTAR